MVRGESREKNSCGDSLPLVKRTAVLNSKIPATARFCIKPEETSQSAQCVAKCRRDSRSPFGKFFSSFPGQVVDGTEDSVKAIAPSGTFRGGILSEFKET